ncbi:unnamed protein product [Cuscuta campestris]|uniref:Uncharacterized protein n=1 Tax=Cuscuta campestris TaxID=132261 RepID=A0A484MNQ2_9ASTE|nr:unnamed protein product [Cuscuta campestris]
MGRAPCCEKNGVKKGPWSPEEDHKLTHFILKHGHPNWRSLPKAAGLDRCGKSCRLRWTNYLRPDVKRGRFSFEEEETIIQLHRVLGNKWSAIAARLPGRTDNEIKNYWNTHIRKRLLRMGIDPATHAPTLHLLHQLSSLLAISNNPHFLFNFATTLHQQGLYLGPQNPILGPDFSSSPNQSPAQPNTDDSAFGRFCAQPNGWETEGEGYFTPPPLAGDYGGYCQPFSADPRQLLDASALYSNDAVFSYSGFRPAVSFSDISTPSSAAALTADDEIGDMLNLDGYPSLVGVDELFM